MPASVTIDNGAILEGPTKLFRSGGRILLPERGRAPVRCVKRPEPVRSGQAVSPAQGPQGERLTEHWLADERGPSARPGPPPRLRSRHCARGAAPLVNNVAGLKRERSHVRHPFPARGGESCRTDLTRRGASPGIPGQR